MKNENKTDDTVIDLQDLKREKIQGQTMQRSIHYYILSLSEQECKLYEGFRDKLIDIQNSYFPLEPFMNIDSQGSKDIQLKEYFLQADQHFAHYYKQDPHGLVVVGAKQNLAIFKAMTRHENHLVGTVEGDYTHTSQHDLGMIVWPVIKGVISEANDNAMLNLAMADKKKKVVYGIEAVGQLVDTATGATLFVEEDYHVKGSMYKTDHSFIISEQVNLLDVIDDVVDIIIEKILVMKGTVIFLNTGSLETFEKIALILRN